MKTKAELAEKYAESVASGQTGAMKSFYRDIFLSGYDSCEARVLELLRSDECETYFGTHYETEKLMENVADWLESKLKGGK